MNLPWPRSHCWSARRTDRGCVRPLMMLFASSTFWFDAGSTWSCRKAQSIATPAAPATAGSATRCRLIPSERSAITSLVRESRLKVISVAIRTAIGAMS